MYRFRSASPLIHKRSVHQSKSIDVSLMLRVLSGMLFTLAIHKKHTPSPSPGGDGDAPRQNHADEADRGEEGVQRAGAVGRLGPEDPEVGQRGYDQTQGDRADLLGANVWMGVDVVEPHGHQPNRAPFTLKFQNPYRADQADEVVERLARVDGRDAGGHHHERPEAVLGDLPPGRGEAAGLDEILLQDERAREDLEGVLCREMEWGMICM